MSEYKIYLRHSCGWYTYVPFDDIFHVAISVCPDCGESVPTRNSHLHEDLWKWDWEKFVGRIVYTRPKPFVWWNPDTWLTDKKLERKQ